MNIFGSSARAPRSLALLSLLIGLESAAAGPAVYVTARDGGTTFSSRILSGASRPLTSAPAPATPLEGLIAETASANGLDVNLVRALIAVESNFDPHALSSAGAVGLMQVIPSTGLRFGVSDLTNIRDNLSAGCRYLAYLIHLFEGNLELALAAYNAGEGAVIKHGRGVPPYPETRRYVPAVLERWRRYATAIPSPDSRFSITARSSTRY